MCRRFLLAKLIKYLLTKELILQYIGTRGNNGRESYVAWIAVTIQDYIKTYSMADFFFSFQFCKRNKWTFILTWIDETEHLCDFLKTLNSVQTDCSLFEASKRTVDRESYNHCYSAPSRPTFSCLTQVVLVFPLIVNVWRYPRETVLQMQM